MFWEARPIGRAFLQVFLPFNRPLDFAKAVKGSYFNAHMARSYLIIL